MHILEKLREKRFIAFCMLLFCLVPLVFPLAVQAAPANEVTLPVKQVFAKPEDAQAEGKFTYTMTAQESGNPMPADSSGNIYTFTITGSEQFYIGPITYSTTGTYKYKIKQIITEQTGYTYDEQEYTLWVYVQEADGELKADVVIANEDKDKVEDIVFENAYTPLASDPSIMVDPPVRKTVNGTPSEDGTFTFKLEAENKLNPMPAGSAGGVKLMTIVGPGEEDFGTWSYTEAGIYHYSISEVNNDESGYTYDSAIYTITDLITDVDGQLEVARTITNTDNKQVDSYDFVNQYTSDPDRGSITGTSGKTSGTAGNAKGVKTGDDTNPVLYLVLFLIAVMVLLAYISYKVRKKIEANLEKKYKMEEKKH